jgi:hypothetical protein
MFTGFCRQNREKSVLEFAWPSKARSGRIIKVGSCENFEPRD